MSDRYLLRSEKGIAMKRVTAVLLVLLTALAVFAACSKNSVHTVTFDSSGGTQIKTQHIRDGESAKKPWDPHKEGFTFIEWQYNGTAFDFNTAITGDITLVASYSIDEGTDIVLLVLCYGDGRENEIIEIKRGEAAFAPPTPEREGFEPHCEMESDGENRERVRKSARGGGGIRAEIFRYRGEIFRQMVSRRLFRYICRCVELGERNESALV